MYSVECSKPSKRCWLNGLNNQRITFFHCLKPANMKNRCCIGPVMSYNISPTDGIYAYCGYPKNQANMLLWKKVQVLFLSIVVIQKIRHSLDPLCPVQSALLVLVSNDKTAGGQRLHARPPFAEIQHLFAFHTCFLGIYLAISYMFSALFIFFYIHHNVHKLAIFSIYH